MQVYEGGRPSVFGLGERKWFWWIKNLLKFLLIKKEEEGCVCRVLPPYAVVAQAKL